MTFTDVEDQGLGLPLDGWSDITTVERPDARVLAAIAVVAVTADAALRSGVDGIGGALVFVATAAGLVVTRRVTSPGAIALAVTGGVLGSCLALRAAEWLLVLDVLAAVALLALASTFARGGDPFDLTVPRLAGRALYLVGHAVLAPAFPLRGMASPRIPGGVVRGVLLAAPVVLLVSALLASADAVFASFFRVPDDIGDLALHGVLLLLGAWWASALFRAASAEPFAMPVSRGVVLGRAEVTTVIASLASVLGVFAAAQAVAFVRGAEYVERTSGLSYAEYARSGFFQLLAVAFVSVATVWALRSSMRTTGHVALTAAVAAGNLIIVAVAVRRLFLYEAAYGLTLLRLVAVVAAMWLGAVLVLTAFAVVLDRHETPGPTRQQWLLPTSVAMAVALLLVGNVVNVEAIIVERNVARFGESERFDASYLVGLSDDATPALVERLDELAPGDRAFVVDELCAESDAGGSWLEANVAVARARTAVEGVCGGPAHR